MSTDFKCVRCSYKTNRKDTMIRHINRNNMIEEINNITNLVALCPNHHYALDKTKDESVITRVKLHSFLLNHINFNNKIRHY